MKQTLLIEIGAEELPPKALLRLSNAFTNSIVQSLNKLGLEIGEVSSFASPRRLAVAIAQTAAKTADQSVEKLGPAVDKAFASDGTPSPAATGFARSCGVAVNDLEQRETDKGKRLAYQGVEPGQKLSEILPEVIATALKSLPIPKRMRWGDSQEAFVRPVHWIIAIHGEQVIPLSLFGCESGRETRGHRFHCKQVITLGSADDYSTSLHKPGYVTADFSQRRALVLEQVQAAAAAKQGQALIDAELLDEVTALVEWPVALAGGFDPGFLVLPREALIATLQGHQRYFPVAGKDGKLLPCFVTVANLESKDPAQVVAGNERVVRPRLSDALFFWETDRSRGLASYAKELSGISFERSLGSVADKSARVAKLAAVIAKQLDVSEKTVARAAELAKADLLSEMVGEFPELQGTMGYYYALAANEEPAVAQALQEQYAPRQSGGALPQSDVGRVLALADKLDTLAGIFAIGKRPSGDKDPFALRRAALGVLRILIEAELALNIPDVLDISVKNQPVKEESSEIKTALLDFLLERLRAYLSDQGVDASVFEAVSSLGLNNPLDFNLRVLAVTEFLREPEAQGLCAAHKRIRNILKNSDSTADVKAELLLEDAEKSLFSVLQTKQEEIGQYMHKVDYRGALHSLAELQAPVDAFFDQVMVMSEDAAIKANRLALLTGLDQVCRHVADISKLSVDS